MAHPATLSLAGSDRPGARLSVLAVGVVVVLVTLVGSWRASLWTDEAATISASTRGFSDLIRMLGTIDAVHGLYYAVMHVWTGVFGISPIALRLPSAIAVGIAAAGVARIGELLGMRKVGLLAAILLAVLPRMSWAAVEARPYALTAALATWCTAALIAALRSGGALRWASYIVLLALSVACNIYVGLLAVGHVVTVLLTESSWRLRRNSFLAAAGAAVIVAPLVFVASGQTGQLGGGRFSAVDLGRNVVVNQWFLGDTPTTTTGIDMTVMRLGDVGSWWRPASILLAGICWLVMLWGVITAIRGRQSVDRPGWALVQWCVPWLLVPTLVIGGWSVIVNPMYSARYLTFAGPAVALLLAWGILALRPVLTRIVAGALILVLAIPVIWSQRQLYGKNSSDWAVVAHVIATDAAAGDGVYFSPRYPVVGDSVGQTTRGIAMAYPGAFTSLVDVTADVTPAAAANLTGKSRLLANSTEQLARVEVVWVIRRHDYPADSVAQDDAILAAAGFAGSTVWSGPLDKVLKFTKIFSSHDR